MTVGLAACGWARGGEDVYVYDRSSWYFNPATPPTLSQIFYHNRIWALDGATGAPHGQIEWGGTPMLATWDETPAYNSGPGNTFPKRTFGVSMGGGFIWILDYIAPTSPGTGYYRIFKRDHFTGDAVSQINTPTNVLVDTPTYGIAYGNGLLWALRPYSVPSVLKINPATGAMTSMNVASVLSNANPTAFAASSSSLYVFVGTTLYKLSQATGALESSRVFSGAVPTAMGYSAAQNKLCFYDNRPTPIVQSVDASTLSPGSSVSLGWVANLGTINTGAASLPQAVGIGFGPAQPSYRIRQWDASASESGGTGTLIIDRGFFGTAFINPGTVSLSAPPALSATISGTAQNTLDYQNLAAPTSAGSIVVTPVNDSLIEGSETVTITINPSPTGVYSLASPTVGTVTIADDDLAAITAVVNDASASETGPDQASITVSRTGPTTVSRSVAFTVSGSTLGSDFTMPSPIVIPAGSASVTVALVPVNDTVVEGTETATLTFTPNAAYTLSPASVAITIADNDAAYFSVVANDNAAAEAGLGTGQFTISRTGNTASALNVTVKFDGSTASNGTDYNTLALTVPFIAGQASTMVTVTPKEDATVEPSETVILTLVPKPAYLLGSPTSATVTIADND